MLPRDKEGPPPSGLFIVSIIILEPRSYAHQTEIDLDDLLASTLGYCLNENRVLPTFVKLLGQIL